MAFGLAMPDSNVYSLYGRYTNNVDALFAVSTHSIVAPNVRMQLSQLCYIDFLLLVCNRKKIIHITIVFTIPTSKES